MPGRIQFSPSRFQSAPLPQTFLRIAETQIALECSALDAALGARLLPFQIPSSRAPDLRLRIELGDVSPTHESAVEITRDGAITEIRRGDYHAILDGNGARLTMTRIVDHAVSSFLRVWLSLHLRKRGGLLVHSACLERDGKAYVFAGKSGAGKTTIASMSMPEHRLLTDEISILLPEPARAFGTPFFGDLCIPGEPIALPLAGIFFIEQGAEPRATRMRTGEAQREMLRHILSFEHEPGAAGALIDAAGGLLREVPAHRLVFDKSARLWEYIP